MRPARASVARPRASPSLTHDRMPPAPPSAATARKEPFAAHDDSSSSSSRSNGLGGSGSGTESREQFGKSRDSRRSTRSAPSETAPDAAFVVKALPPPPSGNDSRDDERERKKGDRASAQHREERIEQPQQEPAYDPRGPPSQDPAAWGRDGWIANDGLAQLPACRGRLAHSLIRGTNDLLMCGTCAEHFDEFRATRLARGPTRDAALVTSDRVRHFWFDARNAVRASKRLEPWKWDAPGRDDFAVDTRQWRHSFYAFLFAAAMHFRRVGGSCTVAEAAAYFIALVRLLSTDARTRPLARSLALHFFGLSPRALAPLVADLNEATATAAAADADNLKSDRCDGAGGDVSDTPAGRLAKTARRALVQRVASDSIAAADRPGRYTWNGPNGMVRSLMRVEVDANPDLVGLSQLELYAHLSRRTEAVRVSILRQSNAASPSSDASSATGPKPAPSTAVASASAVATGSVSSPSASPPAASSSASAQFTATPWKTFAARSDSPGRRGGDGHRRRSSTSSASSSSSSSPHPPPPTLPRRYGSCSGTACAHA